MFTFTLTINFVIANMSTIEKILVNFSYLLSLLHNVVEG